MLYALLGMLLPLFRNVSNRMLLVSAFGLLAVPIAVDFTVELSGIYPSASVVKLQQTYCDKYGITDENFAYWLRDAKHYSGTFKFLVQGALVRIQEFIDGNRYFKVLGLFLLGFYIGRNRLYADLESRRPVLRQIARYGFGFGLPLSLFYAWSIMNNCPQSLGAHSVIPDGAYSVSLPCQDVWLLPIISGNHCSECCFSMVSDGALVPKQDLSM